MSESNQNEAAVEPQPVPGAVAYATMWIRLAVLIMAVFTTDEGFFYSTLYISPLVQGTLFNTSAITGALGLALAVFFAAMLLWALWANAPRLARQLFNGTAVPSLPRAREGKGGPLAVALIVFGVYELFTAALGVVRTIQTNFEYHHSRIDQPRTIDWSGFVEPLIRAALGVWLILGTRGIVNVILRHSGRYRRH